MKKLFSKIITLLLLVAMVFSIAIVPASALSDEYIPLTVKYNGSTISTTAYYYRGTPYIRLETLKSFGDCSKITFSEKELKAYFELSKLDIQIADAETSDFIKTYGGTCFLYLKKLENVVYVPLDTLSQFCKLAYELNGTTLNIAPYKASENLRKMKTSASGALSLFNTSGSGSVSLTANQPVYLLKEYASMCKVETIFGQKCFVMKDSVDLSATNVSLPDYSAGIKTKIKYNKKINVVWHNIGTTTQKVPDKNSGIDVMSPIYFRQIVNGNGEINNYGSLGYTNNCHANGFDVWATVNNNMSTTGATATTHDVLSNEKTRNKEIAQYLFYAALYDVDGICIDYEEVRDEDRDVLTTFVQTMAYYSKKMGITIACAVPPVRSWYYEYNYKAIGEACDYVCLMSYDEHYAGSTSPGSVSSESWYCSAVEKLISEGVSSSKILMGIPFYTRAWELNSSNQIVNKPALSMDAARTRVNNSGVVPVWSSVSGQYYIEYQSSGKTVKIWLEDSRSIATRLSHVKEYNLAGSCCWEYVQADSSIWTVFDQMYNHGAALSSFDKPY